MFVKMSLWRRASLLQITDDHSDVDVFVITDLAVGVLAYFNEYKYKVPGNRGLALVIGLCQRLLQNWVRQRQAMKHVEVISLLLEEMQCNKENVLNLR
jgi:hypothetical protein